MGLLIRILILGFVGALVLSGCSLSTNIKDLDGPVSSPAPLVVDPKIKFSPGHVESTSGPTGMKATITPTDRELNGTTIRAKVSFGQRHL